MFTWRCGRLENKIKYQVFHIYIERVKIKNILKIYFYSTPVTAIIGRYSK